MSLPYSRVLVTGATGFVGARLCDYLANEGVEVHALAFPSRPGGGGATMWHEGDITDAAFLLGLVQDIKPEAVFHLAAYGTFRGEEDVERMLAVNVVGTRNLLTACRKAGCRTFVQAASAKEYAPSREPIPETQAVRPWDEYAITKTAANSFCRLAAERDGMGVAVLRLSPVYGPGDAPARFVLTAIKAALEEKPFTISVGPALRNFTYIDDVLRAFVQAAVGRMPGYEEYNIGAAAHSFHEVVAAIEKATGKAMQKTVVEGGGASQDSWVVDTAKAKQGLPWEATVPLEEGISRTVAWYRQTI